MWASTSLGTSLLAYVEIVHSFGCEITGSNPYLGPVLWFLFIFFFPRFIYFCQTLNSLSLCLRLWTATTEVFRSLTRSCSTSYAIMLLGQKSTEHVPLCFIPLRPPDMTPLSSKICFFESCNFIFCQNCNVQNSPNHNYPRDSGKHLLGISRQTAPGFPGFSLVMDNNITKWTREYKQKIIELSVEDFCAQDLLFAYSVCRKWSTNLEISRVKELVQFSCLHGDATQELLLQMLASVEQP